MHYKNGRPAQNGDKVVPISTYGDPKPTAGILYDATAGNDYCNGIFAPFGGGPHFCPNLKECVRMDDFMAALPAENPLCE
jgi:hypothetical protein